jgi:hypothetical protein
LGGRRRGSRSATAIPSRERADVPGCRPNARG